MRSLLNVALIFATTNVVAADPSLAVTDPSKAGPDYRFVGEYIGNVTVLEGSVWRTVPIGLQVVALGDGQFEATEYLNGLPGAGWDGRDRAVLPGHRDGDVVHINAVPADIKLDGVVGRVGTPGVTPAVGVLRRIVRASPTLGMRPPQGATVLFRGQANGLKDATISEDGLLAQGAETAEPYSDFTMHVEYRLPYMPVSKDQGRGNSGVYLQRRYEVQILDSFGQEAVFNSAGSIYRTKPADVNMAFPPLVWQTYDIRFHPARFEDGTKVANARVTVWHNGIKIHDNYEIPNKTGAGKPEGPEPMPILLQDHNNPVRFRNIWIVDHTKHPNVDATPKIMPLPTPVTFAY